MRIGIVGGGKYGEEELKGGRLRGLSVKELEFVRGEVDIDVVWGIMVEMG